MYIWLWHVPLRIYYKIKCILCQKTKQNISFVLINVCVFLFLISTSNMYKYSNTFYTHNAQMLFALVFVKPNVKWSLVIKNAVKSR